MTRPSYDVGNTADDDVYGIVVDHREPGIIVDDIELEDDEALATGARRRRAAWSRRFLHWIGWCQKQRAGYRCRGHGGECG